MPDMVKSISQIFSNQVFQVPDYQRGYSWERKQWEDLIGDLELLPEKRNHFTGTLVLSEKDEDDRRIDSKGMAFDLFDIIDGQQRLTTIVIFLKAIHKQMLTIPKFQELAVGLQEMYLNTRDLNGQPFTKLRLNEDSQTYFANNIIGLNPEITGPTIRSHERLNQAKKFFSDYLGSQKDTLGDEFPEWLRSFYLKIVHQLNLIVYPVDSELDAGVIFETMNDRGKPLTELELVKNYLLYVSSKLELKSAHDLSQRINSTWRHIYESLMVAGLGGRQNEDQLLRTHWLMAYDYDTRRWQNNRSIKNHFNLKRYIDKHQDLLEDIIEYLDSLKNAATAYCDIQAPHGDHAFHDISNLERRRQIVVWSKRLSRLGSRAAYLPLLIAVRLKSNDDGETYLKVVELCEKFDFRVYVWLRFRSNAGESRLFRLGNQYFNAPEPERVLVELTRALFTYCTNDRFEERFNSETENWYRWRGITYLLYEYETHLAGGRPVQMSWEMIEKRPKADSIEHILPQSPGDTYWQSRFSEEQLARWTHDIGNLTLTYDNSSLSNRSFKEKKGQPGEVGRYAGSPLFVERQLSRYPEWTEAQILERREEIKAWSLTRWHVDPPLPLPPRDEDSIERMMEVAERNGVGEAFEALHEAVLELRLNPRVRKNIQYRPPFDYSLSVMTVQIDPGGFWIYFRLHNFAKFPGISRELVDELLPYKNNDWSRVREEDVVDLVDGLKTLAANVEEKPMSQQNLTNRRIIAEERFLEMAEKYGTLDGFQKLLQAHKKLPMYCRMQRNWGGVKFTPFTKKTEQFIWIGPDLYYSIYFKNFERFFGIPEEVVKDILGSVRRRILKPEEVEEVLDQVERLNGVIEEYSRNESG